VRFGHGVTPLRVTPLKQPRVWQVRFSLRHNPRHRPKTQPPGSHPFESAGTAVQLLSQFRLSSLPAFIGSRGQCLLDGRVVKSPQRHAAPYHSLAKRDEFGPALQTNDPTDPIRDERWGCWSGKSLPLGVARGGSRLRPLRLPCAGKARWIMTSQ
jgi:hypothetical protein